MGEITQILHEGNYSCVVKNGENIKTFTQRGVADLYDLLKSDPAFLKGASIADKVIGKAAASLMILGGVTEIYADTISQSAIDILSHTYIELDFKNKVDYIQNRDQSGWCPLEKLTYEEDSLEMIFERIENFILNMRAKQ